MKAYQTVGELYADLGMTYTGTRSTRLGFDTMWHVNDRALCINDKSQGIIPPESRVKLGAIYLVHGVIEESLYLNGIDAICFADSRFRKIVPLCDRKNKFKSHVIS